jgi:hypothetical protein
VKHFSRFAPILVVATALGVAAPSRAAEDAATLIDKAKAELGKGQTTKAYLGLSNALSELAARTPLFLTAGVLVQGPSRGYGQYDVRPHNAYTRNERIQAYVEPAGFDHARDGELYRIQLVCDYAILSTAGKTLTADRAVKEVNVISRQANTELGVDLMLPYLDLKPGSYILEISVRDLQANDSAKVRLPFKVL